MKTQLDVKPGAFTAEGGLLEPAQITLILTELDLVDYKRCMEVLSREFELDYTSSVFRHNRDVILKGERSLHDGKNPVEGNRSKL